MEKAKKAAALKALEFIEDQMVVGVGTGSTVKPFINALNQKVIEENLTISAVATSKESQRLLSDKILILNSDLSKPIDICVDGADKASKDFFLIKGGGGALLREKFVALQASKNITIIDESKISSPLFNHPLAIEIIPFGYQSTINRINELGFKGNIRNNTSIYITDNGNYIYDITLSSPLADPSQTHHILKQTPGVVETGLFLQTSNIIIIGKKDESVDVWRKEDL